MIWDHFPAISSALGNGSCLLGEYLYTYVQMAPMLVLLHTTTEPIKTAAPTSSESWD